MLYIPIAPPLLSFACLFLILIILIIPYFCLSPLDGKFHRAGIMSFLFTNLECVAKIIWHIVGDEKKLLNIYCMTFNDDQRSFIVEED